MSVKRVHYSACDLQFDSLYTELLIASIIIVTENGIFRNVTSVQVSTAWLNETDNQLSGIRNAAALYNIIIVLVSHFNVFIILFIILF